MSSFFFFFLNLSDIYYYYPEPFWTQFSVGASRPLASPQPFETAALVAAEVYRVLISCIHKQRRAHQNAEACRKPQQGWAECVCGCVCVSVCAHVRVCCILYMRVFRCVCTRNRVWFVRRDECVRARHQCVFLYQKQKKHKKKTHNNLKMKIHIEAASRGLTTATNSTWTESLFFPRIGTFVALPHICMHGTGANNTSEKTAEHRQQQQPHNEAVNKEDVSTSLCFPANKQNGFRTPFMGK